MRGPKQNNLIGGKADNLSLNDIAKKFNVKIERLKKELEKGVSIEFEHTKNKEKAKEIAMDHLSEFPDYYERLKKMEKKAEEKWGVNEQIIETKSLIKKLLTEALDKKSAATELLNDFGMLISLNFSQITKMGVDQNATKELTSMMENLRKPIINGKNYFELMKDFNSVITNPKLLSAVLGKIREYLIYIEPRIQKFVANNDYKQKWLDKINRLKDLYRTVIN